MTATTRDAKANRLIDATSPYLLQHAHNPVDWYPWGVDALEQARKQDKPIFLSIGYAACHWCHVMERESFENPVIAAVLNKSFICIKVDREQRPDLDEIYMNATMIANQGQGGWPMSVFLTPEQKPFFAGTYFPPEPRHGMIGFQQLLEQIVSAWTTRREDVYNSADNLAEAMERFARLPVSTVAISPSLVQDIARELADSFDPVTGGTLSGRTNKFPPSMAMTLMLREYHRTVREEKPLAMLLARVEVTLDNMARGGIYDHLGGGIARYSTDPNWFVPHFEKMLYDQALVSDVYIEAYLLTRESRWADVARDIFDYVLEDLQSPQGGFYSTRDADSEGREGKYYVWTRPEVISVLGPEKGELVCDYYNVIEGGNWEGRNILHVKETVEEVAERRQIEPGKLRAILASSREQLLEVRSQRVSPALDDKILTSWNGLMIASLARGGRILAEPIYTDAAVQAADFVLEKLSRDGRLLRTYRNGNADIPGYLDDYAFFVAGLIELYESTYDARWLIEAKRLTDDMNKHFWDEQNGAFFLAADDAEELIVRSKPTRDGAIPSGNAVALMNLLRLGIIFDDSDYHAKSERTIEAFSSRVRESPFGFDRFLQAVAFDQAATREVVIVGSEGELATRVLLNAVNGVYDPNRVVLLFDPPSSQSASQSSSQPSSLAETVPLLRGKIRIDGKPTVYVCRNYMCKQPVTDIESLLAQLRGE